MNEVLPISPIGRLSPLSALASPQALDLLGRSQPFQNLSDHVDTDPGTFMVDVGHAKGTACASDGVCDQFRLGSLRRGGLSDALFEFPVCGLENELNVINVRPGIVPAFVPALGALLQGFIVAFLILFNQTLQADVASDVITKMIRLKEEQEPRDPAVAVPKGMDAEEIEIKGSQGDERMDPAFIQSAIPQRDQFAHCFRRFGSLDRFKAYPLTAVRILLDDIAVHLFILPRIADFPPYETVKLQDRLLRHGKARTLLVDEL